MDAECLVKTHPILYHMAENGAWPNIRKYGLWSTTALLDMCGKRGRERAVLESRIRPESVVVEGGGCGRAVIRDQKPLIESVLRRSLVNMTVPEYCRLLNKRAFFWANEGRLQTISRARLDRNRPHDVLIVNTETLVAEHEKKISLCTINSGTAIAPSPRGRATFRRMHQYPCEGCKKGCSERIAEVTVDKGVPDIGRHVIRVESWKDGRNLRTVWRSRGSPIGR